MKEETLADVDAAEELPIASQIRSHDTICGSRWKALQSFMQLARAEHGKHHELVEIRSAALDADLSANAGVTAVAAHNVVGLQYLSSGTVLLDDGNARAVLILFERFRRPAEPALDGRKLRHPRPQDMFGLVSGASVHCLENSRN